ncbi:hypothetical protein EJB05_18830, partial [Eragrostis curvula]
MTTITWAMSELTRSPRAMKRAQLALSPGITKVGSASRKQASSVGWHCHPEARRRLSRQRPGTNKQAITPPFLSI